MYNLTGIYKAGGFENSQIGTISANVRNVIEQQGRRRKVTNSASRLFNSSDFSKQGGSGMNTSSSSSGSANRGRQQAPRAGGGTGIRSFTGLHANERDENGATTSSGSSSSANGGQQQRPGENRVNQQFQYKITNGHLYECLSKACKKKGKAYAMHQRKDIRAIGIAITRISCYVVRARSNARGVVGRMLMK